MNLQKLGGAYIAVRIDLDWMSAESYCLTTYGTHLATICNYDDNEEVRSVMSSAGNAYNTWIGLNKLRSGDGSWTWVGDLFVGDHLEYTRFHNTNVQDDVCGQMYDIKDWDDTHCDIPKDFVCNAPTDSNVIMS